MNINYITLLILITLIIMIAASRDARIKGTGLVLVLAAITFAISIVEYVEVWADEYNKSYRILFYKTMLVYWLYPLALLLILYLTEGVRNRRLFAIPQAINMMITAIDLTGTCLVYSFGEDHHLIRGPLVYLPFFVELSYVILIAVHSFRLLQSSRWSKGIIVGLMAGILIFCMYMMNKGVSSIYLPPVIALEVLTYYFYLSAIQYNEAQEEANRSRLEAERNKSNLLMAQIRPHFINSNLAVIRSLCYEDVEKAVETIDHFSEYLRENIQQIDDMRLVSFASEMESVDNYLYLENQRFSDRINVEKSLEFEKFQVPPLSIQTIVENAVRHGISMTGAKGTIWISTVKTEDEIVITVKDDGKGFDLEAADFDGVKHVGIKNVKDRYRRILGGDVEVESEIGEGTTVIFRIPHQKEITSDEE